MQGGHSLWRANCSTMLRIEVIFYAHLHIQPQHHFWNPLVQDHCFSSGITDRFVKLPAMQRLILNFKAQAIPDPS